MEEQAHNVNLLDGVVLGQKRLQTKDAKWLCLENINPKFYRKNFFDIGGTYLDDVADFRFLCKIEQVGDIFLLHIFACNRHECAFRISISHNNDIKLDKKSAIAYLPTHLKEFCFKKCEEMSHNYITTYSFTEQDVEMLKDRKLYIAVSLSHNDNSTGIRRDLLDTVKMNHDFGALLTDPICSDFVIESADGERFNVHKMLLTTHSDVFKAMLKEDTAESQNKYVRLVDVASEDLRGILEFIYTGTIKDLDNANMPTLLMLADKYNLDGLRELAECTLSQQLSVENALDILIVADMYNSDMLKQASLKFIKRNVAALNSSTFKELNNVDLVQELCTYLVPTS